MASQPAAAYDAAIVGGGLAGAATAIHLLRAGRSVVVIERSAAFKRKACGEGLLPRGVGELDELGLLPAVRERAVRLEGVRFQAGSATASAGMGSGGGLGVRREWLDALVLARAEELGAHVRRGVTARALLPDGRRLRGVETDQGDIEARVVIGADGLNSRMRRLAGLAGPRRGTRYGISAHVRVERALDPAVDIFFEGGHELYVTPVADAEANVALLLNKAGLAQFAGALNEQYRLLLNGSPALRGRFELLDEPVAAGPFATSCTRPWRANLVLAGDAAGFFDGITGEGMSVALVSARDCAAAVDRYLRDGGYDGFRAYAARRGALVRSSTFLARVSLALGSRPVLARFAVRNLQRKPRTFAKLVAMNSGELPLSALRPTDLLALTVGW